MVQIENNPSVLTPTEAQVRYNLYRKRGLSTVLLACSEEPCYITELASRLSLNKLTVSHSVGYLENCSLIVAVNESHADERVRTFLKVKKMQLGKRLPTDLARDTAKRMNFYYITERGRGFLEHARKVIFGGEPL